MKYSGDNEILNGIADILNTNLKYQKYIKGKDLKTGRLKDFSDEKEWRYVPTVSDDLDFSEIISSKAIINNKKLVEKYNDLITKNNYSIDFEYCDIKYLFVKNNSQKNRLIKLIMNLNVENEIKYNLLTKICVWDEMEGDF